MLWRYEEDLSPEEKMYQRVLARKKGINLTNEESLEKSNNNNNTSSNNNTNSNSNNNTPTTTTTSNNTLNTNSTSLSSNLSLTHSNNNLNSNIPTLEISHTNKLLETSGSSLNEILTPAKILSTIRTPHEPNPKNSSSHSISSHLSPHQANTYFGAHARDKFFERFQWLSKQHKLSPINPKKKDSNLLVFDETHISNNGINNNNNNNNNFYIDHFSSNQISSSSSSPLSSSLSTSLSTSSFPSSFDYLHQNHRPLSPDITILPQKGSGLSEPTSPRSKYIIECLRSHSNPRPHLLIRKKMTNELRLEHFGMGDDMAIKLATALSDLPFVTVINLSDNNLTDVGLKPLLDQIITMPNLIELDLSENIIGPLAADALGRYLSKRPIIPLKRLLLSKSNVDDFEGERFVRALINNTTIVELDLSHNLLGHSELLNVVKPNIVTATEALSTLLESTNCNLEELKLSWNMIRLDSAIQLAKSLAINSSLTYLDLSYNGIGQFGGLTIGDSLLDNRTLRTLLLSNNNINASACFTIAIGLEMNLALRKVCLDGNPIADQGAQALMNVPASIGSRIDISASGCNVDIVDDSCWFDQSNPCGNYRLNLSNPFERAIAFKILSIVANHSSYTLAKCIYEVPFSKKIKKKQQILNLTQGVLQDKIPHLNHEEKQIIINLYQLQESVKDPGKAMAMFHQYDIDGSGEIDKLELNKLLKDLGMKVNSTQLDDIMNTYDIDGGGTIEIEEFMHFIKSQYIEATERIRDLTESLAMVISVDDESEPVPYLPPRTGFLKLEVIDSFTKKNRYRILSSSDQQNSTVVASKIGNVAMLLPYSFNNFKLRLQEGYTAYISMYGEVGNKLQVLTKILPQMSSPSEARILLSKVTNDDKNEIRRLKVGLRFAKRPIFGLENGYYLLDLSKKIDRICLSRLLEFSKSIHNQRIQSRLEMYGENFIFGDTSQYNNSSCFRNERLNGNSIKITPQFFTPMPKNGKLEFDFSSISRPDKNEHCLSDAKCIKLLVNLALLPSTQKGSNKKLLEKWKKQPLGLRRYLDESSRISGDSAAYFYSNLSRRSELFTQSLISEEIRIDVNNMIEEGEIDGSKRGKKYKQDLYWKYFQSLMNNEEISDEAKSARILDQLEDSLGGISLYSRHVANIVEYFTVGKVDKCQGFGSYRVEFIVSFFPRIIDIDRFEIVLSVLTPEEIGCLYCRLGWLNLFNPLYPQGAHELCLSRWEERQVLKCLLVLAMTESGDNIVGGAFRWQRDMDSMPGWTVTVPWLTEEGLPNRGIVNLTYSSNDHNILIRKSLSSMVLLFDVLQANQIENIEEKENCDNDNELNSNLIVDISLLEKWQGYLTSTSSISSTTSTS